MCVWCACACVCGVCCVCVRCVCVCSYTVGVNVGKLTMAFYGTMITLHCIIFSLNMKSGWCVSDHLISRWVDKP